jgi:putative effector of murein hydrolase
MTHILERFFIHFAASTFLTLAFYFALWYWAKRNMKVATWLGYYKQHVLLTAALLVCALLPLREPYDIYMGNQVWYKAIFDQASWFLGAGVSAWGLYRFAKA